MNVVLCGKKFGFRPLLNIMVHLASLVEKGPENGERRQTNVVFLDVATIFDTL
jgi:hypothetical protein